MTSTRDMDWAAELAGRGNEVAAATSRLSPDTQWTVGFGLVGLGFAIAIRAGIRSETQRALAHTPAPAPTALPSRREMIELHEHRLAELRQLEEGAEADGES